MSHSVTVRQLSILLIVSLVNVAVAAPVCAEHRAALLIGNHKYKDESLVLPASDMKALAAALEKHGVHCTLAENVDDLQKLRAVIIQFADRTPTRGTAMIVFAGQVLPGSKGNAGLCLLACDSKRGSGVPVEEVLDLLHSRGGSDHNMVILDAPAQLELKEKLPPNSLVTFADSSELAKGLSSESDLLTAVLSVGRSTASTIADQVSLASPSLSISPPDQFVTGRKAGDEWVNARGMVFCWCPPGRYIKGSPADEPGRYPDEAQKEVVIPEGFWISKYEMTLRENLRNRPLKTIAKHKNDPLTMVNFDDARSMTQRTLTASEQDSGRLPKEWQYNLTTEEQWEYAARAGTTTRWSFGDDEQRLPEHANFADKSWYDTGDVYSNFAHRTLDDGSAMLARVGSYKPNPWGIHDMNGNVAEWCTSTAIRGGSWASLPANTRAAFRHSFSSRNEQNFIGYRLVIQKVPEPERK